MSENNNRETDAFKPDIADNHTWADRVAADRQKGLEKIGLIAVAAIAVAAILIWLW